MKIVLASSNKGKIKEIKNLLPDYEVVAYSEVLGDFEIVEDGISFKENAILKAKAVDEKLKESDIDEYIVIADDSGLTVPALNNEPGIYSARYAGENASDKDNNKKLVSQLKENALDEADAYYTACLAISYKHDVYTTHGWLHGKVIVDQKGENGFGYDPMFIPNGYDQTIGELDEKVKKNIGHRAKGLKLAMKLIRTFLKH